MARWGWSSPFQSDQSLMEAELLPRYNEGRGKVNFEIRKAEEDSEPGFDNPVRVSVTEEDIPDYEVDEEAPDYDTESQVGGSPSTMVQIPTDPEGQDQDDDLGSVVVEKDIEMVPSISSEGEECRTSGIESLENKTGSFETSTEKPNEDYEDELDTRSVRTIDPPDTVRMKTRLETWKRGVAPLLVQGANTIRLRRKELEALNEESEAIGQKPRSKADFTIFIDEKKKQSMVVDEEESKREKRKRRRAEKWKHFRAKMRDLSGIFALWSTTFKEIEGHFGGATVSYFRFVKWLLLVNMLSSLVIICSTVIPQVILPPKNFEDTVNCSAYPSTTTAIPDANHTLQPEGNISFSEATIQPFLYEANGTEIPPEVGNYREEVGIREACWCSEIYRNGIKSPDGRMWYMIILDILQGTEWMELSVLFLGYYFDKPLYLSSLAFLFTVLACFAIILWLIVLYIASALRKSIVDSPGANKQRYSELIFERWDHNLMNEEAAERKKKQLCRAIVSEMQKDFEDRQKKQRSRGKKFGIFILRLIVAVLVAAVIAATGLFLYLLITDFIPKLRDIKIADAVLQELFNLLLQYLPSMALTFVNTVLPLLFQLFLKLALLTQETEFAVLLVLTVFVRLSSIAFLVITLFSQMHGCQSNDCHTCPEMPCWENRLGQAMYTLAIIDFLTVFVTFLVTITFGRCCCGSPKKQKKNGENGKDRGGLEFNVSTEVLSAVYTQTMDLKSLTSQLLPE